MVEPTNIAIIGYGRMGKELEKIAPNYNLNVTEIFEIDSPIQADGIYEFDVAVDFTNAVSVEENLRVVAALSKNIVIGTTGWADRIDLAREIVERAGIGCVYTTNFSIGMNIFRKILKTTAKIMDEYPEYDVAIHEMHHRRKKDHPSGTALSLATLVVEELQRKRDIATGLIDGLPIDPAELEVSYLRIGEIAGTHTVYFDSDVDTIELTHRAKNRSGLAVGAARAARWLAGKKGFYDFEDII